MENTIKNLIEIGLTKGEAKVYVALSESGSSTVGPIVNKSKVAYSNIYDILNRLIEKGLVSFIIKNKTKYFSAAPPSNIKDYLDKKEKEVKEQQKSLDELIPKLEKLQEIEVKQNAEIFLGEKGLRTAYKKLYEGTTKKDEIVYFYIHNEEYAEKSNLFYNSIWDLTKNQKNRGIANKEYKKSWFSKKASHLKIKFSEIPIPANIDIIKDKILIASWSKETIFSILITSENLAKTLKDYFEKTWKIAKS